MQIDETMTIDPSWSDYDKTVSKCHLNNYGKIYVDGYGQPVDDFEWLEGVILTRNLLFRDNSIHY